MGGINLLIRFDRSSVCMGDDCVNHSEEIEIDGNTVLSMFIKCYISKRLAFISGGKATWVLRVKDTNMTYKNIAVMAQQWSDAKLLVHDYRLKELAANNEVLELFALYRQQEDPDAVYSQLVTHK
jgi:hypothetical protein